ncbi:uncharacterized protein LOC119465970 [Dermacentor silvarum]|uniref:uncharacterized protein LOC119465970 n=1 Tax=Dermacentor silvarum TaxID=543639 RepID=UPI001899D217|nr:uncharacterized protein LOC119465970 [Dermacentor silvarum]
MHTDIEPSGFPRHPGSSMGGTFIRSGNAPNGFPQLPDSSVQISGNNVGGNVVRTGSVPNGFPQFPRFDIRTNGNNVGEPFVGTNRVSSGFPQRPGFGVPKMRNDVGGTVIKTNIMLGGFPQRSGFGLDNIRNGVGAQILRDEAPLIREIETKMHEGREMERNLTAVRDAIRQEMVNARGIGPIRRIKMYRKLGQLESRIKLLHGKNEEGEQRFRAFVSGVASGEISDRRSAHTILDNIFNFYGTVVEKIVVVCRSFAGGIINFYKRIFLSIGSAIHRLLSLKLRPLQAGINIIAGI